MIIYRKRIVLTVVLGLITLSCILPSQSQSSGRKIVFKDEFGGPTGSAVDPTKWTSEIGGGGWGNQELQHYTNSTDNTYLNGSGSLVIKAVKLDAPLTLSCWYGPCQYTSGRLITKGKFDLKFGRFEARIRIPKGQGIWPAFWLLGNNIDTVGWPRCGEIDIMENIGREPSIVHGTIHGPGYSGGSGIGASYTLPDNKPFSDDYHVYALEWSSNKILWYVDGKLYQTLTPQDLPGGTKWVFDHPYFLLLNLAVGGGWPGSPDQTTTFPQMMLVDYVRVYSL
jgi:beta-glucanase (GH16 family)